MKLNHSLSNVQHYLCLVGIYYTDILNVARSVVLISISISTSSESSEEANYKKGLCSILLFSSRRWNELLSNLHRIGNRRRCCRVGLLKAETILAFFLIFFFTIFITML